MNVGSWNKSRLTTIVVIAILAVTGTAMAASGVSTLVTSGDGGAVTAQGSQQLGTLSATPDSGITPSGEPDKGTKGKQGAGGPDAVGNEPSGAPTQPVSDVQDAAPGTVGGGGTSLPFTGYLLIPVLLIGVLMLGAGVALRRRSAAPSAAA